MTSKQAGAQYFEERPGAATRPGTVDVVLADVHLRLATDSGVFSPGRLDPGTRVLLESVPPPPQHGDLLDLGCGYGPIALTMASRAPSATVWAVDVNRRSVDLCARNAASNGLDKVRSLHVSEVPPEPRFAAIWSNPAIRIGKPALHAMLTQWLDRLTPDGAAYLVVQKHLGADSLQRWLNDQGWPTERVTSRSAYRVLRATARRTGDPDSHPDDEPDGDPVATRSDTPPDHRRPRPFVPPLPHPDTEQERRERR
ncbi:16S rRNA (guanine1207-N2)-methyltransferase [Sphaerisporangium rubeum]|uniref:16S rRNA (Guanine1207-N2)-methyltransferase n=1 Tax=Sphaerisporangium rubeum TaxID=321317 RepID=A0A7X0IES6_9ACTN|nr:16S rRNA (guanine1207-N2)-methyltransferase [Sphaerisporangium rubeum]